MQEAGTPIRPTRLGVFGGTFDPPHNAHVVLAVSALHQLRLDKLLVTPAGVPWQKSGTRQISPAATRLSMAHAAFDPLDQVEVSSIEIDRSGDSYTVDTLETLTSDGTELFLLVGADVVPTLSTWHRYNRLAELAHLVIFPRPGFEGAVPPDGFTYTHLELPALEISSTNLRHRLKNAEPVAGLLPRRVIDSIDADDVYGEVM